MEVRPRHLEGMKALGRQIICAGGLLDEQGKMKDSALVMEFPDRAAPDKDLRINDHPESRNSQEQSVVLNLPANLSMIESEAFTGLNMDAIRFPAGVIYICLSGAADCDGSAGHDGAVVLHPVRKSVHPG